MRLRQIREEDRLMPCVHLRELYSICQEHDLKITSSDLVRIVCKQCGVVETCPSMLAQDYDRLEPSETRGEQHPADE